MLDRMLANGFKQISNNGQHNNGIFVNYDERRLIKKEPTNFDQVTVAKKLVNIFPKIYNFDDSSVEMEMYDCDITHFLLNILPKHLAEKQPHAYLLFTSLLNNSTKLKKLYISSYYDIDITSLKTASFEYLQQFASFKYLKRMKKSITWLENNFASSKLTFDEFVNYIKKVFIEIKKILENVIIPKIRNLLCELNQYGYYYCDRKYDNFVCNLEDNILIKDVKIIDWSSGLFKLNSDRIPDIDFNGFMVNGQYNLSNVFDTFWRDKKICQMLEDLTIPTEIKKILQTKITYD
jgi:hypothetical protein